MCVHVCTEWSCVSMCVLSGHVCTVCVLSGHTCTEWSCVYSVYAEWPYVC